jgi:GNAT superfamily N-acetyltransferase
MVDIVKAPPGSHHRVELRARFIAEWGQFDAFDTTLFGAAPPPPLLALRDRRLLGGLAFSHYPSPRDSVIALWINGLQVDPAHRRQGIASALVRAAEREAQALGVGAMFVRTQLPALYQAQGWQLIEASAGLAILGRDLCRDVGDGPAAPLSALRACRPS